MSVLVSAIVCAFNVEGYIDRCVQSIVDQTYSNIEIIIVDDGSTDSTPGKCDSWAGLDPHIRVIHQRNAGVAAARERGIHRAHGEYVFIVDSDDWVHPQLVARSLEVLSHSQQPDLLIHGCQRVTSYSTPSDLERNANKELEVSRDAALQQLLRSDISWEVWRLFFKRSLLDHDGFQTLSGIAIAEDLGLTFQLICFSRAVSIIQDPLYYYFQRKGSAMDHTKESGYALYHAGVDSYQVKIDIVGKQIQQDFPRLISEWSEFVIRTSFYDLTQITLHDKTAGLQELRSLWEGFFREWHTQTVYRSKRYWLLGWLGASGMSRFWPVAKIYDLKKRAW